MAGAPTLNTRYKRKIDELVELSKRAPIQEIRDKAEEFIIAKIFEIINIRVIRILKEMDCQNASTLCRGLIGMFPTEVESLDDLVEKLVAYHKQEKLAISKYKSKNKTDITEMDLELLFDKMLLRTRNEIDTYGKETV